MEDNIKACIRSILIEFQERNVPTPILRDINMPQQHPNVKKAWVLMGMRRTGKNVDSFPTNIPASTARSV